MKKRVLFVLLALMLVGSLSVVACGGETTVTQTQTVTTTAAGAGTTTTVTQTAGPGATATVTQTVTGPATTATKTVTETKTGTSTAAPQVFKLKLQNYTILNQVLGKVITDYFVPAAEEMSGGQLDITVYEVGAIADAAGILAAVRAGTVDMAHTGAAYYTGEMGPPGFFGSLPYMVSDVDDWASLWYKLGIEDLFNQVWLDHGVRSVGTLMCGDYAMFSTKEITSVADFKGMKIRSYGAYAKMFEKAGASMVSVSPTEVYTAMTQKIIDAATYGSPSIMLQYNFQDVAKYYVGPSFGYIMNNIIINPAVYDKLPETSKMALKYASYRAAIGLKELYRVDDIAAMPKLTQAGVKFINLSAADQAQLRAWAKEVWVETAGTNATALKMLKILQDYWAAAGA